MIKQNHLMFQKDRIWSLYLLLFMLWLGHSLVNYFWLRIDTRPPFWDTAGHAAVAIEYASFPYLTNTSAAFHSVLNTGIYPPLLYFLSIPFAKLMQPTIDVLLWANSLFVGILIISTYGIAAKIDKPTTGLLAAFLISFYPIVYGLSRHYLLDIPLTAAVSLSICLLIYVDNFEKWFMAIIFGVSLGLGMLTKWTFVVFVAGPFLITIIHHLTNFTVQKLRNLGLALIVAGCIALPWYIYKFEGLLDYLSVTITYGGIEKDPTVGTWLTWRYYIQSLVEHQLLWPFTVLFIIGLGLFLWHNKNRQQAILLLIWILVPYLLFSLFSNKDIRYTLPYLPAIAVITALGLVRIRHPLNRRVGLILVLSYTFIQFSGLSFGLSQKLPMGWLAPRVSLHLGSISLTLYAESVHIASAPRPENWQTQTILDDIIADASEWSAQHQTLTVAILPNAPFFEPQGFIYQVKASSLPIHITFITDGVEIDRLTQIAVSDYVVTKTGSQGPHWTLQDTIMLTEEIQDPSSQLGRQFVLVKEYNLPDGSNSQVFRRITTTQ